MEDLVVKSKKKNHLENLRQVFDRLRRHQLKMNPHKCAFEVTLGTFLDVVDRHLGNQIDRTKIDALLRIPKSLNIHELTNTLV